MDGHNMNNVYKHLNTCVECIWDLVIKKKIDGEVKIDT